MAGVRQIKATGRWEFVVKRAGLLPKPLYFSFDDKAEGEAYCARIEAMLDRGIVPPGLETGSRVMSLLDLVREYERDAHPSDKDRSALGVAIRQHGKMPLGKINAAWVDGWIASMKRVEQLAPASIRARIGALARCTDWGMRKGYLTLPDNALRGLPDGYAQYTDADRALTAGGRDDVERDRRLEPGEFDRIMAVLDAGVLARKQRPLALDHVPALRCLFVLALESAMRLREMYTLELHQVDLAKRTVFLDKTKNGDKRQVPLSTVAVAALQAYLAVRQLPDGVPAGMLFPWWDGVPGSLRDVSDRLSKLFGDTRSPGIFVVAGCVDLGFHDLRHEATCRLFERTKLSDTRIMKITGHKSQRMLMRYANLRASDLADGLW